MQDTSGKAPNYSGELGDRFTLASQPIMSFAVADLPTNMPDGCIALASDGSNANGVAPAPVYSFSGQWFIFSNDTVVVEVGK